MFVGWASANCRHSVGIAVAMIDNVDELDDGLDVSGVWHAPFDAFDGGYGEPAVRTPVDDDESIVASAIVGCFAVDSNFGGCDDDFGFVAARMADNRPIGIDVLALPLTFHQCDADDGRIQVPYRTTKRPLWLYQSRMFETVCLSRNAFQNFIIRSNVEL